MECIRNSSSRFSVFSRWEEIAVLFIYSWVTNILVMPPFALTLLKKNGLLVSST